jgi:hypothetical protein
MFSDIKIRAYRPQDVLKLKEFLRNSKVDADLLLPHGFVGQATETVVAENEKNVLCAITGTLAIVLDPLIRNPDAKTMEIVPAIIQSARALEFYGTMHGVTEAYAVISDDLGNFQKFVERMGYERVSEGCGIFKRLLVPNDACNLQNSVEEKEEKDDEGHNPSNL